MTLKSVTSSKDIWSLKGRIPYKVIGAMDELSSYDVNEDKILTAMDDGEEKFLTAMEEMRTFLLPWRLTRRSCPCHGGRRDGDEKLLAAMDNNEKL